MKAEIRYRDGTCTTFDNLNQETLENEVWPKIYVKENLVSENENCTTREILSSIYEIRFELPSRILKVGLLWNYELYLINSNTFIRFLKCWKYNKYKEINGKTINIIQ